MNWWRAWVILLAIVSGVVPSRPAVQPVSPSVELGRYPGADPGKRPQFLDALTNDQLATFIERLRHDGPIWVSETTDDAPRRRLVFAAVALEAADAAQWWNRTEYDQPASIRMTRAARPLIEAACALLRTQPIGDLERQWMLASVAYGQGAEDSTLLHDVRDVYASQKAIRHLDHALAVYPTNPRLKLAAALATEDWSLMGERVIAGTAELNVPPAQSRRRVIGAMESLTGEPTLAAEAELHIAFQQFLMNDSAGALASFKRAGASDDPHVRYLGLFLAGRMLNRLGQPADAEESYRLALVARPRTQSGVEALAARLMLGGDRNSATILVDEMLAAPREELDAYFLFPKGDYRRFPEYMTVLRRGLKR